MIIIMIINHSCIAHNTLHIKVCPYTLGKKRKAERKYLGGFL